MDTAMNNESARPRPLTRIRLRMLQCGVLEAFLAGIVAVGVGAPIVASAAPVACNAASLVTALAAVSGSGQSGTVTLTAGCT